MKLLKIFSVTNTLLTNQILNNSHFIDIFLIVDKTGWGIVGAFETY